MQTNGFYRYWAIILPTLGGLGREKAASQVCHEPSTWVVVKIMVPFWVPVIIRHLLFRVPKKGP